jgi:hypothetical protein
LSVLPNLHAQRGFLLAATGHPDDADAELAALAASFPAYPHMAVAELRIGVLSRVRRGDFEGAADVAARATPNVPLPLRDEMLMDLVRLVGRPGSLGAADAERLHRELRADREVVRWLEVVAPALLQAFETSPFDPLDPVAAEEAPRVEARFADDHAERDAHDAEHDAEREADAALEAAQEALGEAHARLR